MHLKLVLGQDLVLRGIDMDSEKVRTVIQLSVVDSQNSWVDH